MTKTLVEFFLYSFDVYYTYVAVCCIWYTIEFLKREPLDTLSLPNELMYRLTFGFFKEKNDR